MKKILETYLLGLLLSIVAVGCDVHEFPVPEPEPKPEPEYKECMLKLVLEDDAYDLHHNLNIGQDNGRSRATEADGSHDLRYIVRAYRYENSFAKGSRVPSRTIIDYYTGTIADDASHPDLDLKLILEPGEYDIVAWADHVKAGTNCDHYHATDDFMEIRLLGAGEAGYRHFGSETHRVAWRGYLHVLVDEHGQVSLYDDPDNVLENLTMDMERPMARYHFITNDLSKFIENEMSRQGIQAQAPGAGAPEAGAPGADAPGADAPGHGAPQVPNLADYKVIVRYTGYMPCAYNLFTDKPMDSATGVYYEGEIKPIDANTAELSFDHVLVNHSETSVQVSLELYRLSDNQKLSSTDVIDVPLKRGHYTTVTGPMLTTTAGTQMGIVPDFDGEFNIRIE